MSLPPGPTLAVAAAAAGLACWLALPPPAAARGRGIRSSLVGAVLRPGPGSLVALTAVTAGLLVVLDGTRLALGLVLLAGAASAAVLVRRARAARRATARRAAVVEV